MKSVTSKWEHSSLGKIKREAVTGQSPEQSGLTWKWISFMPARPVMFYTNGRKSETEQKIYV